MNCLSHVSSTLRALMKGVQANGALGEADLDDVVCHSWIYYCINSTTQSFVGQQGQGAA